MSAARKLPAFAVCGILLLVSFNLFAGEGSSETRQEITLRVAVKTDIATTNIMAANDMWTRGMLFPVYMSVGMLSPDFNENYAYILKGVDADESGVLDSDEYGVFNKEDGLSPRSVTAYYDLNGVLFHDGVQATKEDLLFSYHLEALMGVGDVLGNSLDILKDKSNLEGSNYSSDRWLWVYPVNDVWDTNVPVGGNSSLTFALHFELQSDYNAFVDYTLSSLRLFPRHLWEVTGRLCLVAQNGVCSVWETPLHEDFWRAYDPNTENGVPASSVDAFNVTAARSWAPDVRHVIGTGPFEFVEWVKGSSVRLDRYEDFLIDAVDRNGNVYLRRPYIGSILYTVFKTAQAAVLALQAGEVDATAMISIPAEFLNDLMLCCRNIEVTMKFSNSPFYLGYDMRELPFGYLDNDPSQEDVGYYLRKAISHAIPKKKLVTTVLQNFGVIGDQPVNPAKPKWYNASVTKYDFDLDMARQILDDHYTYGGKSLGWSLDNWRNLPGIGDSQIDIITYLADFEPRCYTSTDLIASNFRSIGINARVVLLSHGMVARRVADRSAQMWLLPEEITSNPPDYYYEMFYSGKAQSGKNYAGFQNETVDRLVLQARSEYNVSEQTRLIKEASGLLADSLPIDVLFYRLNIEAYRMDKFTNFTTQLYNSDVRESFWTLIGIHPPIVEDMTIAITAPSAVQAGSSNTFHVLLQDYYGVLPNVRVDICVNMLIPWEPGNITLNDKRGPCISSVTDTGGRIVAVYEAPEIGELEEMRVSITAQAKHDLRKSNSAQAYITVYPKEKQFLSVLMQMTAGDVVALGYALPFRVEVTDQNGMRLDGVKVNLTSYPEGIELSPTTGTTVGGFFDSLIEAPSGIELGSDQVRHNIVAGAELAGYEPTTGIAQIVVIEMSPASDSPPPDTTYEQISLALIAVMVSASVVLALIRLRRSRK